jgi:dual specificity tyrosine-phosphorylation-regulated kinase 2/3/4
MAPEVLNFILYENEMEYIHKLLDYTQKYDKPWVIDMWSLGCVLLEIVSGIPLWMSLKTLATKYEDKTEHIKYGLFAVKGRLFDKIIRRQIEVIQNLDQCLEQENYSGIKLEPDLKALLKRMLALNPNKRISPSEVI